MSSAAVDVTQPSWVVQILFGRYQSTTALTWTEIITTVCVGVLMVYVYLFFLRLRFRAYAKAIHGIPSEHLPIRKQDMSRKMYSLLINETVRVDRILENGIQPEVTDDMCGDPGWGKDTSRYNNVHFSTSIAKSFFGLEKTALSRRPGLTHREHRTVRSYVEALRKAFPALPFDLCEEYVNTYEQAVFGQHKFTFEEYNRFSSVVYQLVAIINGRHVSNIVSNGAMRAEE